MKKHPPRFSKNSIEFLKKAGRQKKLTWLDRYQADYERLLKQPMTHLALTVASKLSSLAPDYHFPKKSLARIKRSALSIDPKNGILFKDWIHYSAARPRESRFEHNPNLFFLINAEDKDDPVLVAGGLYMPSSRQLRALREAIAEDASAFEDLFASKEFKKSFPDGFSDEKTSKRPARGYDPEHPRMHWIRLQAFFVWKSYSIKEFSSATFAEQVTQDFKQIIRLNKLIDAAVEGRLRAVKPKTKKPEVDLFMERIKDVGPVRYKEDF